MTLTPRTPGFCPQGAPRCKDTLSSPSHPSLHPPACLSLSLWLFIHPAPGQESQTEATSGQGREPGVGQTAGLNPLCPKMVFLCPPRC